MSSNKTIIKHVVKDEVKHTSLESVRKVIKQLRDHANSQIATRQMAVATWSAVSDELKSTKLSNINEKDALCGFKKTVRVWKSRSLKRFCSIVDGDTEDCSPQVITKTHKNQHALAQAKSWERKMKQRQDEMEQKSLSSSPTLNSTFSDQQLVASTTPNFFYTPPCNPSAYGARNTIHGGYIVTPATTGNTDANIGEGELYDFDLSFLEFDPIHLNGLGLRAIESMINDDDSILNQFDEFEDNASENMPLENAFDIEGAASVLSSFQNDSSSVNNTSENMPLKNAIEIEGAASVISSLQNDSNSSDSSIEGCASLTFYDQKEIESASVPIPDLPENRWKEINESPKNSLPTSVDKYLIFAMIHFNEAYYWHFLRTVMVWRVALPDWQIVAVVGGAQQYLVKKYENLLKAAGVFLFRPQEVESFDFDYTPITERRPRGSPETYVNVDPDWQSYIYKHLIWRVLTVDYMRDGTCCLILDMQFFHKNISKVVKDTEAFYSNPNVCVLTRQADLEGLQALDRDAHGGHIGIHKNAVWQQNKFQKMAHFLQFLFDNKKKKRVIKGSVSDVDYVYGIDELLISKFVELRVPKKNHVYSLVNQYECKLDRLRMGGMPGLHVCKVTKMLLNRLHISKDLIPKFPLEHLTGTDHRKRTVAKKGMW